MMDKTLYIDDAAGAKDTQSGLVGSEGDLHAGAGKNVEPSYFFAGLIDDVRIHSAALRTDSTTGRRPFK